MRLVTMRTPAGTRAGRVDGDDVIELPFPDVGALLASGEDWRGRMDGGPRRPLAEVELAPVVVAPHKILCLGLNYRSHIEEMGRPLPTHPTVFAKFARALIGAGAAIMLPPESAAVDWEAELALVVGATVRRAPASEAVRAIAGYTVANDVTLRDWQQRTNQWLQGKTFEATTPVGPALVTTDEIDGDPGAPDLEIRCTVDGVEMQRARTGDLLFAPAEIVAYLSTMITLEPGDLILTGTPGGVGAGRDPKVFLEDGQTVRTAVEGLGELVNPCRREPPARA